MEKQPQVPKMREDNGVGLIAIVDDDLSIRDAIEGLLRSAGYEVETFASAEGFLESGAIARTECLILDVRMPGMDGLQLQRRLRSAQSAVPVVFVTAHDNTANRHLAFESGAVEFLCKPFQATALVEAIQAALGIRPMSSGVAANQPCGSPALSLET